MDRNGMCSIPDTSRVTPCLTYHRDDIQLFLRNIAPQEFTLNRVFTWLDVSYVLNRELRRYYMIYRMFHAQNNCVSYRLIIIRLWWCKRIYCLNDIGFIIWWTILYGPYMHSHSYWSYWFLKCAVKWLSTLIFVE